MIFRGIDGTGVLFVLGVGLLAASLVERNRITSHRTALRSTGWTFLAGYWGLVAIERITDGFVFLGATAAVVGTLSLYATTLSFRERPVNEPLSQAFVGMGLVYAPFEHVDPIHGFGLEIVAHHTAFVAGLFGTNAAIDGGTAGYENVLVFANPVGDGVLQAAIISACTGISAIALFSGLVAIADVSIEAKVRALLVLVPTIYALNIVRNVFTVLTYGNHSFAGLAQLPLVGGSASDPYFSYVVAEQFVAPLYIVSGVIVVYYLTSNRLPGIRELFAQLFDGIDEDLKRVGV